MAESGAQGARPCPLAGRSSLARVDLVSSPIHRRAYDDGADLADLAAAYLVGFARSQGFSDGKKRTGVAAALVFLVLNGHALHVPATELYALTMRVATNEADDQVVAEYFRSRVEPTR